VLTKLGGPILVSGPKQEAFEGRGMRERCGMQKTSCAARPDTSIRATPSLFVLVSQPSSTRLLF